MFSGAATITDVMTYRGPEMLRTAQVVVDAFMVTRTGRASAVLLEDET